MTMPLTSVTKDAAKLTLIVVATIPFRKNAFADPPTRALLGPTHVARHLHAS